MIKNIIAILAFITLIFLASYLRITEGAAPWFIVIPFIVSMPFAAIAFENFYRAMHDKIYPKKFKIK
jgi:hypothetical protein